MLDDRGDLALLNLGEPLAEFLHRGPAFEVFERGGWRCAGSREGRVAAVPAGVAFD